MTRKYTLPSPFQRSALSFQSLLGLLMLAAFFIPHQSYAVSISDFNLPPQDANGWTVLQPEAASRIVYVDSSLGNDNTGQVYSPGDSVIGPNPQSPSGSVQAFETLTAAFNQTRDGAPDWMLLKSGEVWENESLNLRRGLSDTKRAVVSSYGSGDRPSLRSGRVRGIHNRSASNVIISGIKFWAHTRDKDGPYFQSYDGTSGFDFYNGKGSISNVLFEDCVFRSYDENLITGSASTGAPVTKFVIRRSIISGNYSTSGHSQGLFYTAKGQPSTVPVSILLEENLFDHNGWRIQSVNGDNSKADGQATIFNHNTYFGYAKKVIFTGNIFSRASSMGNKWRSDITHDASQVIIDNNLYIEGEIGAGIGGNESAAGRFYQFEFTNNVLTDIGRTRPTNRYLAWSLEILDWDNGKIINNLFLNSSAEVTNTIALKFAPEGGTQQIDVRNNYIYNKESTHALVELRGGAISKNVNFADNIIKIPYTDSGPLAKIDALGGYLFNGKNGYFSNSDPAKQFLISNNRSTLSEWISYTGDTNLETPPDWQDPDRNLERYASEMGLGYSLNNLIDALHKQSKNTWRSDLTAVGINNWFREGFATGKSDKPIDDPAFKITSPTDGSAVIAGQSFMVKTNVNNPGNVNKVDFWHDSVDGYFGSVTSAPYEKLMNEKLSGDNPHAIAARVTYNDNSTELHIIYVNVNATNTSPTASYTVNCTQLSCDFDSSASTDSDGSIAGYNWNFGDGGASTSSNPSHTYNSAGTYSVTLTVTDNSGAKDTASQNVTVEEAGFKITSPADGSTVRGDIPLLIKTNANFSANVKKVEFWHGSVEGYLGSVTSAPFEMLLKEKPSMGNPYPLAARVTYNDNSTELHIIYVNVN